MLFARQEKATLTTKGVYTFRFLLHKAKLLSKKRCVNIYAPANSTSASSHSTFANIAVILKKRRASLVDEK